MTTSLIPTTPPGRRTRLPEVHRPGRGVQSIKSEFALSTQLVSQRALSLRSIFATRSSRDFMRPSRPLTSSTDAARKDRKSTRLNSSHVKISYAVFCLKKKKKKYNHSSSRKKKTKKKQ